MNWMPSTGFAPCISNMLRALFHTDVPGGAKVYAFTDVNTIPHDSNLTIHVLLQLIADNTTKKGKRLNIQLDNCFRENKNRYLLGLAFLFVDIALYERVDLNFLPVGHTHEDVDQFFSRIAQKLRLNNIYTLDDLHRVIEGSFTPKVKVCHIHGSEIFNVKEWLSPYIEEIGNHSKPRHFRFCKVDGQTQMFYRSWACDPWRPNDVEDDSDIPSDGLRILKSRPDVTVSPERVMPTLEKLDPQLPRLISGFGRRLPDYAKVWWNTFLSNLNRTYIEPGDDMQPWSLPAWVEESHATEHQQVDVTHLDSIENDVVQHCPQITVGSRKRPLTIVRVDDFSSMEAGMMIAVFVMSKTSKPQIGRVLQIEDTWFQIHWYTGSWKSSQKPNYVGVGRNRTAVTEWLDQKCALLWDFHLTAKNSSLQKTTQVELKARYSEIEAMLSNEN